MNNCNNFCDCLYFGCFSHCGDIVFAPDNLQVVAPIAGDYIIHYKQVGQIDKSKIVSFLINEAIIFPSDLFANIGLVTFALEVPGGSIFEYLSQTGKNYDCFSFDRQFILTQPQQI